MGKYQRRKGKTFEQKIARLFRPFFPTSKRHLEFQCDEAEQGTDVIAGSFRIQCKAYKSYAPINKIEEINSDGIPLLITKGDYKRTVVAIYLDDFLDLLEKVYYS